MEKNDYVLHYASREWSQWILFEKRLSNDTKTRGVVFTTLTETFNEPEFIYISNLICEDKELDPRMAIELMRKLRKCTFIKGFDQP